VTAIERVTRIQRTLGVGVVLAAVLWGTAVTLGILVVASLIDLMVGGLEPATEWRVPIAAFAGLAALSAIVWRGRYLASREKVALWIEERIPSLHYSLVTAIETERTGPFTPGLEAAIARENIRDVTIRALRRAVLPAASTALAAAALLYVAPASAINASGLMTRLGARGASAALPDGNRLANLRVRITPPPYTRRGASSLDDPPSIAALTGSRIVVSGNGRADGIRASAGATSVEISSADDRWSVSLVMPSRPAALSLSDGRFERLLVLEPRADAPPGIVLRSPLRDSTLRSPQLVVQLTATATDDLGLNGAYFEYLVTTGSGEIFSARTITTPVVRLDGAAQGSISARLDLFALKLSQGDVVSIRAIAQDRNTLSGPGLATSDTRTFRIARADEYDSIAVDAAAPAPVDSSAMSQRMLIIMTEDLVKKEKTLARAEWVKQSTAIGELEDRLRKRVDEILYPADSPEAEGHSEDPGHVHGESENSNPLNKDLLEAYNALWEAVRSLQIAEPAPALPPMRVALEALDRARLARRVYLRGTPPKIIVDLARVRLSGKEKGSASIRTPLNAADTVRARLAAKFNAALEMIPASAAGGGAVRALTMLRVEALSSAPSFAAALSEALMALRSGADATLPLLRARRALYGEPEARAGLPSWSGIW